MTTTDFLRELKLLHVRMGFDVSPMTHEATMRYVSTSVWYCGPDANGDRRKVLTVPVTREDSSRGYLRVRQAGQWREWDFGEEGDSLPPDADYAALAVGLTLLRYYSDAVDTRKYGELVSLARAYLTGTADDVTTTMAFTDYLVEREYCTEG